MTRGIGDRSWLRFCIPIGGQSAVIISRIHDPSHTQLLEIADALDALRLLLRAEEKKSSEKQGTESTGQQLPTIARRSVATALAGIPENAPAIAGDYLNRPGGVFVTLRHRHGELRGCIGTIAPACENVAEETWRNARLAALNDGRFAPVTLDELPDLRFEVSVLHPPEEIVDGSKLDPQRYGVIVSTEDGRRGLLLPGIKEIATVQDQLLFARRKGRIDPDEPATLQRFEVDHFAEA